MLNTSFYSIAKIAFSGFVFLGFTYIGEPISFFIWLLFLEIGCFVATNTFTNIKSEIDFHKLYFLFSTIGLIICIDNYNNFDNLFGYAADDMKFYALVLDLLGQDKADIFAPHLFLHELKQSCYSYFLSITIYPISLMKHISLTDLLPINWMLISLTGIYISKITRFLLNKRIPAFLFYLSFVFVYSIMDSTTRLYRDPLLLLCLAITILLLLQQIYQLIPFLTLFIIFLRIANLILPFLFILTRKLSIKKMYIFMITVMIVLFIFYPLIFKLSMMYGSEISRVDRYSSVFSKFTSDELSEIRFKNYTESDNKLYALAYSANDPLALSIRTGYLLVAPLRLSPFYGSVRHYELGFIIGYYLYHVILWISSFALLFYIPLTVYGMLYPPNQDFRTLTVTIIVTGLSIVVLSGQYRHMSAIAIFFPVFVTNGYYVMRNKTKSYLPVILSFLLLFLILVYNFIR